MRTDSVKKYVIPNIPYLFILWACLKLGTAYRLAPGADFAHKLMGLGQSIGPAFADFAPGLHPFDWLIGIVGAVGFRLLIYTRLLLMARNSFWSRPGKNCIRFSCKTRNGCKAGSRQFPFMDTRLRDSS